MSCICGHEYILHGAGDQKEYKGCVKSGCECQEYTEAPEWQSYLYLIPAHLRDGMLRYLRDGIEPGHFLTAVLENNMMEAMGRADEMSRAGLYSICQYLYNHAPGSCYGSPERVQRWMRARQQEARLA